jgi:tetratricopeptide (TPR) repeat protein
MLATHLRWLGRVCNEQADYENAKKFLWKSLELFRSVDDEIGVASALQEGGWTLLEFGEHEQAETHFRDSLEIRKRANDRAGVAENLSWLARLKYRVEMDEEAEMLAREALHIQQEGDDKRATIITLRFLALACNSLKRFDEAKIYGEQALNLSHEIDDIGEIYSSMYTLSQILRQMGNLAAAKNLASESAAHFHHMGDRKSESHANLQYSQLCADMQEYDEALISVDRTIYLYDELVEQWWMVRAGMLKGVCLYYLNRKNEAKQIWLQTLKLAKDMNHPLADALEERLGWPGMDEVE